VLKDIAAGLLDLVYPRVCLLCRQPLTDSSFPYPLCPACFSRLQINRPPFCSRCSRPIATYQHLRCPHCAKNAPVFDRAWGVTLFDERMRHLIHLFKYGNKTGLRAFFGRLMADFIRLYHVPIYDFDGLLPAPLHAARRRERGYNQSDLLAESLKNTFNIPIIKTAVRRLRNTSNQARLSQKERWTNIARAFKINQSLHIRHKNILIIDDLLTTGATASEITRVLKNAGAANVCVLTLSITNQPHDH